MRQASVLGRQMHVQPDRSSLGSTSGWAMCSSGRIVSVRWPSLGEEGLRLFGDDESVEAALKVEFEKTGK